MIVLSTDRLALLKERTEHCCCKYCGGALEIRRILFNDIGLSKIEIFCSQCSKIEYGVEKEIYQSARYFVEESGFDHYPQLDATEQTQKMNVAKVAEIMSWIMQHTGLLNRSRLHRALSLSTKPLWAAACFWMTSCCAAIRRRLRHDPAYH